jgi:hypothetical protein
MVVKSAFLQGHLIKGIYMEQPPSFEKDVSLVTKQILVLFETIP